MISYLTKAFKNRLIIFNRKYGYLIHEKIVKLFFGEIDDIELFNIDERIIEKLKLKIKKMKKLKFSNYHNQKKFKNFKILSKKTWIYNKRDQFVYDQFDSTQEWFDIDDDKFFKDFTKSLFPIFKKYLKSYFSVVNIRVWNNLPNGKIVIGRNKKERGSYRNHKDGFPPGHVKVMIYLNKLDKDHGYFIYEDKEVKSKIPGLGIAFKNSDLFHRAVVGKTNNRYVIEYTLLRTLTNVNSLKYYYPSTPDTMYLTGPIQAYF